MTLTDIELKERFNALDVEERMARSEKADRAVTPEERAAIHRLQQFSKVSFPTESQLSAMMDSFWVHEWRRQARDSEIVACAMERTLKILFADL